MAIIVYNRKNEEHVGENNYPIFRPSILSNPYTHIKDKKTKALYVVKTREEAINRYSHHFDVMYGRNTDFTKVVDEIYEKYRRGEDVYLECYCHPEPCHGDIIAEKLQCRLIKEKIFEAKQKKSLETSK